jgi:hypothetical protein
MAEENEFKITPTVTALVRDKAAVNLNHSEMNGEVFQDWLMKYLLPNVASNSVLVFDRAIYHLELTEESKGSSMQ